MVHGTHQQNGSLLSLQLSKTSCGHCTQNPIKEQASFGENPRGLYIDRKKIDRNVDPHVQNVLETVPLSTNLGITWKNENPSGNRFALFGFHRTDGLETRRVS